MAISDRAFRALSRAHPDVVAAMLHAVAPGFLPEGASVVPDDVAATQVDALPPAMDADWAARVAADDFVHLECQGYRDTDFGERLLWYHLGFALRYRRTRRVRTIALWLAAPPRKQPRDRVTVGDITVQVRTVVLPEIPAATLLSTPKTACFAAGADAGAWETDELCARVAAALKAGAASWAERHMAVIAAAMRGRYESMVRAMEQANLEPVIIEDLVKFGEDRGYARGVEDGEARGRNEGRVDALVELFALRLGRPLRAGEREALGRRVEALGAEAVGRVVLGRDADAVAAWLAEPAAK